jgi:hypothetical protein
LAGIIIETDDITCLRIAFDFLRLEIVIPSSDIIITTGVRHAWRNNIAAISINTVNKTCIINIIIYKNSEKKGKMENKTFFFGSV